MTTPFEQLQQITDDQGVESGLDFLEQHVRRKQDYAQPVSYTHLTLPTTPYV